MTSVLVTSAVLTLRSEASIRKGRNIEWLKLKIKNVVITDTETANFGGYILMNKLRKLSLLDICKNISL